MKHLLIYQSPQPSQSDHAESKRTRVSRLSPDRLKDGPLPSPMTHQESTVSEDYQEGTVTASNGRPSQAANNSQSPRSQRNGNGNGIYSPPSDTQPFTQPQYPPDSRSYAVEDEEGQEVWGYLVPTDGQSGDVLVLRRREACPVPNAHVGRNSGNDKVSREGWKNQEEEYENEKSEKGVTAGGYLIGRHRECGML